MKKVIIYLICGILLIGAFSACNQNVVDNSMVQGISNSQESALEVSETTQVVSLDPTTETTPITTVTPIITPTPDTTPTTTKETTTAMNSTKKEPAATTVPTTKSLKYEVTGTITRSYIEQYMSECYNAQHHFMINDAQYVVRSFAFNNAELKKKYGDDFDILTGGGNSGTFNGPYFGGGYYEKKGKKVGEGSYVEYIVKKGAHPATGEAWRFDISFLAQEGWRLDDFYFDQEYTDACRAAWNKGDYGRFSIEILE
jgi:hypothetical protein